MRQISARCRQFLLNGVVVILHRTDGRVEHSVHLGSADNRHWLFRSRLEYRRHARRWQPRFCAGFCVDAGKKWAYLQADPMYIVFTGIRCVERMRIDATDVGRSLTLTEILLTLKLCYIIHFEVLPLPSTIAEKSLPEMSEIPMYIMPDICFALFTWLYISDVTTAVWKGYVDIMMTELPWNTPVTADSLFIYLNQATRPIRRQTRA